MQIQAFRQAQTDKDSPWFSRRHDRVIYPPASGVLGGGHWAAFFVAARMSWDIRSGCLIPTRIALPARLPTGKFVYLKMTMRRWTSLHPLALR